MPPKSLFLMPFDLLVSRKQCKDTFFPILHHLSPVILANVTEVAFVLLHNSRFNFCCYTQREPTPTQKFPWKWQLRLFTTYCTKDYEGHSLMQASFAELPNNYSLSEKGERRPVIFSDTKTFHAGLFLRLF